MTLSNEEIERYQPHILLKEVGGAGQAKLKNARVLVVGAGGLGSSSLLYLAAAGVGTLGIIDHDTVDLSNLQRQIIHGEKDIARPKTASAKDQIADTNPHVNVITYPHKLNAANAMEIIAEYDLVLDGCDNFKTRYLINDACYFAKKPLISAAVGQFEGQVITFKSFEHDETGTPCPNYRCLYEEAPHAQEPCATQGILGALTGIIGSLQAMEALKEILNIGESLSGKMLIYDGLNNRFNKIKLCWNPDNPLNGETPTITDLSIHSLED